MKTLKKVVAIVLVVALSVSAGIFGTLAYLTDEEEAVNVAVVGNVYIDQIEQELDENGKLVDFTQAKPIIPAVYPGKNATDSIPYADAAEWPVANDPAWKSLDKEVGKNVLDKFVTVKNTGNTNAYVRTVIAFEGDPINGKDIHVVANGDNNTGVDWEFIEEIKIDGVRYDVIVFTYENVLKAGETTVPSLKQVYMDHTCGNEDAAKYGRTYDILVLSQAVQADGFANAKEALNEAFGEITKDNAAALFAGSEFDAPAIVYTAEELETALAAAAAAGAGDTSVVLGADVDMTGIEWTPINVDGYHGAGVVRLDGGNHTITGLTSPLFEGGFAGKSGIVIKNLTIADSEIESASTLGAGAFIAQPDSMHVITLENCHLKNSTVNAPDARSGGLIGWASGYAKLNDGPVKAYITIKNCSVTDSEVIGTAVGGIAGHPGASDYTWTTIENCMVSGNKLTSTDNGNWRVGAFVGTANNGHIVIKNSVMGKNEMTQPNGTGKSNVAGTTYPGDEVGRFVPSGTGTLEVYDVVDATVVADTAELKAALAAGEDVYLTAGEYTFPSSSVQAGATIICEEGTTFEGNSGLNIKGATVVGATFSNDSGNVVGGAINGTFKDCTFDGSNAFRYCYAGETVVFENCVFSGDLYGVHFDGGDNDAVFRNCTFSGFNAFGSAITKLTLDGCTFVANGRSEYNGVNLWGSTDLVNCTFIFDGTAEYEWVDACGDNKVYNFTNCVVTDGTTETPIESVFGDYGTGNTVTFN